MLCRRRTTPTADLVIRGARVLDPVEGVDAVLDVRVDGGTIARARHRRSTRTATASSTATGLVLAPAFVDPHVHLRTPGREDEETIASGTAGRRRRRLLRDPRHAEHRPGRRLGGVLRRARRARRGEQAEVPVGFLAAITKGQEGGS